MIRTSIRTCSLDLARKRRDAMVEADDAYWASLIEAGSNDAEVSGDTITISRYKASKERAMARGYIYTPVTQLAESAQITDILSRLTDALKVPVRDQKEEVEALLGGSIPQKLKISKAFDLYCREIAVGDLHGKSAKQRKDWEKVKRRAVNNFISLCGDLHMDKISRKHGREFYIWWGNVLTQMMAPKPCIPIAQTAISEICESYTENTGSMKAMRNGTIRLITYGTPTISIKKYLSFRMIGFSVVS